VTAGARAARPGKKEDGRRWRDPAAAPGRSRLPGWPRPRAADQAAWHWRGGQGHSAVATRQ